MPHRSGDRANERFWRPALRAVAGLSVAICGCGTVKQTGTARTGTEQILLTSAWDDALQKVDFRPLTGAPVFLDTTHLNGQVDEGWIVSSMRQAMLSQGVLLRSKPEQAEWIVEASVGAYGTDSYNWLVGVQQMTMPVAVAGLPTGTIPEIPLVKKSDQHAVAKLSMFAYDRSSGQLVWRSGTQLATANAKDAYVGGMGPIQSGTIRPKDKKIGINVPIIADPYPTTSGGPIQGSSNAGEFDHPAATMGLPPSAADLESFSPDGH